MYCVVDSSTRVKTLERVRKNITVIKDHGEPGFRDVEAKDVSKT